MALKYWWFSATLGLGMSTAARPTASSSASVSAPARLMTRSAAASSSGILLMYSFTTRPSPSAKFFSFSRSLNSCTPYWPVAWRCSTGFFSCCSHAHRSATTSLTRRAPRLPPKERITVRSPAPSSARMASRSFALVNTSGRTGLPTTMVLSGAPSFSTAAGTAANTRSTSGASSLLVTPGKAFCS